MKNIITTLAICAASTLGANAFAGVSADEAKQLGTTLTPWGAEVAGNKDGTIPAYTGGLTKPPADFKPGSGIYVDPYKDEKPLFSITAKNMAQYADKLSESQKLLLTRHADFRMDVYPTHRTMALPKEVSEATIKNATRASTKSNGSGLDGAEGGLPFPIPKTGHEVMWNHLLTYNGEAISSQIDSWYVDQNGRVVDTGLTDFRVEFPYYQPNNPDKGKYAMMQEGAAKEPAALSGQLFRTWDPVDPTSTDRRAWQYVPGQRRVKVVPELAYDTPYPGGSGMQTMDDLNVFQGPLDRYNFKLVGKREIYLPYNLYKLTHATQTNEPAKARQLVSSPKFLNPDYMRWELHRVWVVEAELLPGKRHIYKKRVFYFDEDGYGAGMSDQYDNAGKLFRFGMVLPIQLYDRNAMHTFMFMHYDFSANVYMPGALATSSPIKAGLTGPGAVTPWTKSDWAPDAMGSRGVR